MTHDPTRELDVPALERMSWRRVQEHLDRNPRLLLAVGAMEQSGIHLPLGVNFHVAQAVVDRVAARAGILRAPGIEYGVNRDTSGDFPGTATLARKTLHRTVNELLADWEDHGVQEFILVTDHRSEAHLEALLLALTSRANTTVFDLSAIEVADLLEGEAHLEHGGERDTSLMLHLHPRWVEMDAARDVMPTPGVRSSYRRGDPPTPPRSMGGICGYPSRASARKGHALMSRYVQALCQYLDTRNEPQSPDDGINDS